MHQKGKIPDKLKTAGINATFWKGWQTWQMKLLPVSILAMLLKVYEKCLYKQVKSHIKIILSNFQCNLKKVFNAQRRFIDMIQKAKKVIDKGGYFSALLTDRSKVFECLSNDLIKVKLDANGFWNDALY